MARMTSLTQTSAERMESYNAMPTDTDVPPGMCLTLTDVELGKLGIEDTVEVGDLLHLHVMIQATSVRKDEAGCCVCCKIIAGAAEDEMGEDMEDE